MGRSAFWLSSSDPLSLSGASSNGTSTGYLAAPPTDPFDGNPLRYRAESDRVTIYSVGPDQRDDGGEYSSEKGADDMSVRLTLPSTQK